jgi:hypothetical protein
MQLPHWLFIHPCSFLIGVSKQSPATAVEYPDWVYVLESLPELNEHYHVGFIDCLTNYGFKKKTAHMFKSALWNVDTVCPLLNLAMLRHV